MTKLPQEALGHLADILEPEFPDAAAFLKSPKGRDICTKNMGLCGETGCGYRNAAYRAAVSALWDDEAAYGEAGDFLSSRAVRDAYYVRVREENSRRKREAERAAHKAAERWRRLNEKLDRLTRDGVLTKDEREELDRDGADPY